MGMIKGVIKREDLSSSEAGTPDAFGNNQDDCHRYDFLVCLWNGLNFFSNFLNFIFTWD